MKAPPLMRSFLYERPSMKTLTCSGLAPALPKYCPSASVSCVNVIPGARPANARKLRLLSGRLSICCGVMLVATTDERVSTSTLVVSPTTVVSPTKTFSGESSKLTLLACPSSTVTVSVFAL